MDTARHSYKELEDVCQSGAYRATPWPGRKDPGGMEPLSIFRRDNSALSSTAASVACALSLHKEAAVRARLRAEYSALFERELRQSVVRSMKAARR